MKSYLGDEIREGISGKGKRTFNKYCVRHLNVILYYFAIAAIQKYYRLAGLDNRNLIFSQFFRSRFWQG